MNSHNYFENAPTLDIFSEAVSSPVTVDAVKLQLRCDTNDEDELITSYIKVAAEYLERITGIAILEREYVQCFRSFALNEAHNNEVMLLRHPATAIIEVGYRDTGGVEKILDPAVYMLTTSKPPRMCLKYGQCWPATDMTPDSVRVFFKAGYTAATIPPELKQCVTFIAAHFFENRTPFLQISNMCEVPLTLRALIDSLRVFYW